MSLSMGNIDISTHTLPLGVLGHILCVVCDPWDTCGELFVFSFLLATATQSWLYPLSLSIIELTSLFLIRDCVSIDLTPLQSK